MGISDLIAQFLQDGLNEAADGVLEIDSTQLTLDQVVETVLDALPAGWR